MISFFKFLFFFFFLYSINNYALLSVNKLSNKDDSAALSYSCLLYYVRKEKEKETQVRFLSFAYSLLFIFFNTDNKTRWVPELFSTDARRSGSKVHSNGLSMSASASRKGHNRSTQASHVCRATRISLAIGRTFLCTYIVCSNYKYWVSELILISSGWDFLCHEILKRSKQMMTHIVIIPVLNMLIPLTYIYIYIYKSYLPGSTRRNYL